MVVALSERERDSFGARVSVSRAPFTAFSAFQQRNNETCNNSSIKTVSYRSSFIIALTLSRARGVRLDLSEMRCAPEGVGNTAEKAERHGEGEDSRVSCFLPV